VAQSFASDIYPIILFLAGRYASFSPSPESLSFIDRLLRLRSMRTLPGILDGVTLPLDFRAERVPVVIRSHVSSVALPPPHSCEKQLFEYPSLVSLQGKWTTSPFRRFDMFFLSSRLYLARPLSSNAHLSPLRTPFVRSPVPVCDMLSVHPPCLLARVYSSP